jgi:hypothetical protein
MVSGSTSSYRDDDDRRDRLQQERLLRQARARDRRRDLGRSSNFAENVETIERVADRVANDVNALVRAWSAANAETVKGAVTVIGNIALDLFGGASRPSRRSAREPGYAPGYAPEYTPGYTGGSYGDTGYVRRRTSADRVEEVGDDVAGFTHSLSDALAGAASVVSRSSRRFQDEYDSALDDAEEGDRDLGRDDTDPRDTALEQGSVGEGGAEQAGAEFGAGIDQALGTRPPPRKRGA